MKQTVNDETLRSAVVKELDRDAEVFPKHISVTAVDGAIALGGHVMTVHEKQVAVRAAERVPGVGAVADGIEVRPPDLHERADDEIAEEVAHLRRWPPEIPDSVAAQVQDGHVILHGHVATASERTAAQRAVSRLPGVHAVDNLIEVSPVPTAAEVERRVQSALERMADGAAHSIRVTADESTVHLQGQVPSLAGLEAAVQAAESTPGVTTVESQIIVTVTTRAAEFPAPSADRLHKL